MSPSDAIKPTTEAKAPFWLITGFGLSLTLLALQQGHRVIATSRTLSKIPHLVKQVVDLGGIWHPLGVTTPRSSLQAVVGQGITHFGKIDVLVNSAGVGTIDVVEDFSDEETEKLMQTNFYGPVKLI